MKVNAPKKILLVSGDPALTLVLGKTLKDSGYETDYSTCGLDALKRLKERRYGLVITEAEMPFMSGMDFYMRAVREHAHMKDRFLFVGGGSPGDGVDQVMAGRRLPRAFKAPDLIHYVKLLLI